MCIPVYVYILYVYVCVCIYIMCTLNCMCVYTSQFTVLCLFKKLQAKPHQMNTELRIRNSLFHSQI